MLIFIPRHTIVAGYYGFTLDVRVSVRPSVSRTSARFSFPDDNLSKTSMDFHQTWYVHWYYGDLFGVANGQISSKCLRSYLPVTR